MRRPDRRRTPWQRATPTPPTTSGSSSEAAPVRRDWTLDEVRRLGMTTDLETAAHIIGIGRTLAYDLARTGDFPIRLLRLGRRVFVPVADLLTYLGVNPAE